jgi:hypothetical protein
MGRALNGLVALVMVLLGPAWPALADPAGEIKARGLSFILANQNPDQGFPLRPGISLAATGADPKALGMALGFLDQVRAADHGIDNNIDLTALWIKAQVAARGPTRPVQGAGQWLLAVQHGKGGLSRERWRGTAQVISTAVALEGLLAAGMSPRSDPMERGLGWLLSAQNKDGGWPLEPGGPSLALSTARVLRALGRLRGFPKARGLGKTWLMSCQGPGGGFGIVPRAPADPELTALAVLAIRALGGPKEAMAKALTNLALVQEKGGGFVSHVPPEFNGRDHLNLRTTNLAVRAALEKYWGLLIPLRTP